MSHETQLYIAGLYVLGAFVIAIVLYFIFRYEAMKDQEHNERLRDIFELKHK